MADTQDFFDRFLPEKLEQNPQIAREINAVYGFDIDGAGQWTVDLTSDGGTVSPGLAENAGCTVSAKKADFEKLLDNPGSAMMLFTMGKLKVTNVGLALSLQKLLT